MAIAPPLIFAVGLVIVAASFLTAIHTFMLPGSGHLRVARLVIRVSQRLFLAVGRLPRSSRVREAVLSFYAPVSLLAVYGGLLLLNGVGYAFMFYALGDRSVAEAMVDSASALSTLGFRSFSELPPTLLSVAEALMTTTLAALLIGYLPTITAAYLDRERGVAALEAEVDDATSGVAILDEYVRSPGVDHLPALWKEWTHWFDALGQSHSTLSGALFLRSPRGGNGWVTVSGAVLDAAALAVSALEAPGRRHAERCLSSGGGALRSILESLEAAAVAGASDGISVSRAQFDAAWDRMTAAGAPMADDRDAAWAAFVRARAGYEAALRAVGRLTLARVGEWDGGVEESRGRGVEK